MRLLIVGAATPATDEVGALPNLLAKPCWNMSSGYLSTGSRGTQLFYWYHEAVASAHEKPLILWLNGGPGCSSLGGMFTELGPLVVGTDGNVTFNQYSWNRMANVLFLEQPAGVGFSYPNLPANDSTTADETYRALLAFFALHPELTGRKFYVMGESCAAARTVELPLRCAPRCSPRARALRLFACRPPPPRPCRWRPLRSKHGRRGAARQRRAAALVARAHQPRGLRRG